MNLELTVLDYDMLGGSDAIGKVTLGKNRKKLEKKHWVEMVENPRRPIIHWHQLKVLSCNKRQDRMVHSNNEISSDFLPFRAWVP